MPQSESLVGRLDTLAAAMVRPSSPGESDSTIPPVFTYFGQFVDHDITANTDRDQEGDDNLGIDRQNFEPVDRSIAEGRLMNLRRGTLDLDSVYGDGPNQSPLQRTAEQALRDPHQKAKMLLGTVEPFSKGNEPFVRPELPRDEGADIPRFGQAVDGKLLTLAQVRELQNVDPDAVRAPFELRRRALIGDSRNDENLLIAQLHLAFLRLHNAVVDELQTTDGAASDDALFAEARQQVTWNYQWLVVNEFLPKICDPEIVADVLDKEAPIYRRFFEEHQDVPTGTRPMPLEFSVAAYRFGHSMVRDSYDFNRNFGTSASSVAAATFELLFKFTGGGNLGANGNEILPDNWIIEWDRLVNSGPSPAQFARKIDTALAPPLATLANERPGVSNMMQALAARNLRRGYLLNMPTGQATIEAMSQVDGISIEPLSIEELTSGSTGEELARLGFETHTPLWFYVLKEAEVQASGNHLGKLGSRIVAETLIGLLVTDSEQSYFKLGKNWKPSQSLALPVETMDDFFRAAGVLA